MQSNACTTHQAADGVVKVIAEQWCGGAERLQQAIAEGDVKVTELLQARHCELAEGSLPYQLAVVFYVCRLRAYNLAMDLYVCGRWSIIYLVDHICSDYFQLVSDCRSCQITKKNDLVFYVFPKMSSETAEAVSLVDLTDAFVTGSII